ncbi:E2F DP transcription factor [Tubulinosema ratisbonensis]|uniref:E2F DP transcription factor n=1 Tax=Tubulinosema ratisbonensis TaxID=291195 RepID=A0A437AJ11_9MICR|nr:E2F DP transcription factor [Tubulinosema ratisbonensis]
MNSEFTSEFNSEMNYSTCKSEKSENTLLNLTKRFLQILSEAPDQSLDLNTASYLLNVSKRRIYDITNVLEGLDLIKKPHVNTVKWIGDDINLYINGSIGLEDEENYIENEINRVNNEIEALHSDINDFLSVSSSVNSRFVRIEELKRVRKFKDKILLIVKISENTKIEFKENNKGSELEITDNGEQVRLFHIEDE